jgi:hypothetical protein
VKATIPSLAAVEEVPAFITTSQSASAVTVK